MAFQERRDTGEFQEKQSQTGFQNQEGTAFQEESFTGEFQDKETATTWQTKRQFTAFAWGLQAWGITPWGGGLVSQEGWSNKIDRDGFQDHTSSQYQTHTSTPYQEIRS